MGWNISLICQCCKRTVFVEKHKEGSIFNVEGTTEAELSVTYNYGGHFRFPELLHDKKAKQTIKTLQEAVVRLGVTRDEDYWASTLGNVGYTCNILLNWAKEHPKAIWKVI